MFSELSFGNDQHTALGVQKLASFALVFSWSMVLRPSLPILRVILAFSVVSLLFRSLLFSLLCRYCFPMVSFQSRSLSSHDRRVALLWHFGDGRLLGNPWDRTGTSQEARSIDFSNFLGREKHRTIHTRHYLPISQTQRIAFRDKTSNLILLVALPSKLYLLVPAPHSVWSS
ncbi:hypothetical protein M438DRAFT_7080 [Aureobasidium pullulans EXF-150]|uniref:Uncharacterized protein n=1 Tax=Aureobasidium pullulans EXF-150 TaxID=1043002 RepID=A0A074Y0P4_AURPU|nr:uncharacterized protein M438DRAFT_7080 [Aureobasidium pullulans EXF-150]KEQ89479.1 hypothetical protein M438DRAFT_7080 [Aureobasidium pullulans EXF-150]